MQLSFRMESWILGLAWANATGSRPAGRGAWGFEAFPVKANTKFNTDPNTKFNTKTNIHFNTKFNTDPNTNTSTSTNTNANTNANANDAKTSWRGGLKWLIFPSLQPALSQSCWLREGGDFPTSREGGNFQTSRGIFSEGLMNLDRPQLAERENKTTRGEAGYQLFDQRGDRRGAQNARRRATLNTLWYNTLQNNIYIYIYIYLTLYAILYHNICITIQHMIWYYNKLWPDSIWYDIL